MKKFLSIATCLIMVFAFAACSKNETPAAKDLTSTELVEIINECGGEMPEYNPPVEVDSDSEDLKMFKDFYGLDSESMTAGAVSFSLRNTQAYAIMVIKPAEGKAEDVKAFLDNYTNTMLNNFDRYLIDQYEIAKRTVTEEVNGYIVYVMDEDAQTIADAIKAKLG